MCALQGRSRTTRDRLRLRRRLLRGLPPGLCGVLGALPARPHRRGPVSTSRCCAARWRCSRRASSGPRASPATWAATCARAGSPACTRRRRGASTSRPTRPTSGRTSANSWACRRSPPTSATTRCASAERAAEIVPTSKGALGPHRARVGGAFRRAGALRDGARGRGHVRPPAGRGRGPGRHVRASGGGTFPRPEGARAHRLRPRGDTARGPRVRRAFGAGPRGGGGYGPAEIEALVRDGRAPAPRSACARNCSS